MTLMTSIHNNNDEDYEVDVIIANCCCGIMAAAGGSFTKSSSIFIVVLKISVYCAKYVSTFSLMISIMFFISLNFRNFYFVEVFYFFFSTNDYC